MRNLLIGLAAIALIGCGGDNNGTTGTNGSNNGTAGSNNGTAGTNNGTAATNNGTAATNNGTAATNNGTAATNNGTAATNNGTAATNNGTTAAPSANCTTYCDLTDANCADLFADRAACEAACADFADDGTDCTTPGDCAGADTGVQCRAYHASAAAEDAATHCPHASIDGGGVCN